MAKQSKSRTRKQPTLNTMAELKPKKTRTIYSQEAIEKCRGLYCRFGGKNLLSIEREMRKQYPGWQRQILFDKGRGKNARLGWVTKYGFDNSLKLHLRKLTESVNDDEQDLYLGIKTIRRQLQNEAVGEGADKDVRREYREYAKLEIEARRNLDLSRDNLETFVSGYEKLIGWLSDIDPEAARLLIKNGDRLAELAQAHYGKEESNDGANFGADESGE